MNCQKTTAQMIYLNPALTAQGHRWDYIPNFIGQHCEPWIKDLKRRVQHYGYRYDYKARTIDAKDKLGDLPEWAEQIIGMLTASSWRDMEMPAGQDRIIALLIFEQRPDQIIVNEYEPEQGIAAHTDRDCFGPVLASISLGGTCNMNIKHAGDRKQDFKVCLEPRSLIVFRGESREKWKHGLQLNKKSVRRVSLTFRTVLHTP